MSEIAYGCPGPGTRLTELQRLQHEGALEIIEAPLSVDAIVQAYRLPVEAALSADIREPDSDNAAFIEAKIDESLRHMIMRPLGYLLVSHISEYALRRSPLSDDDSAGWFIPNGQRGRAYADSIEVLQEEGGQTIRRLHMGSLARITRNKVAGAVYKMRRALEQEHEGADQALKATFGAQTIALRKSTVALLDARYSNDSHDWKGLDPYEIENPHEANLPDDEIAWLLKLKIPEDLGEAFLRGSVSVCESATAGLYFLHTALYKAGWPKTEYWPVSHASVRKLSINAQLRREYSNRILTHYDDPKRENIFSIHGSQDDPTNVQPVHLADSYHAKVCDRRSSAECQGALERSALNDADKTAMCEMQDMINDHSGRYVPDVDFRIAGSSSQMLTSMAVLLGEANNYQLDRHR